jgi:UDP-N-acetylglucosamine--N-acetylmuramyl-(pentapeptide) pyrophosphoryl-undecaprenol N-acetylglucosamine transferase
MTTPRSWRRGRQLHTMMSLTAPDHTMMTKPMIASLALPPSVRARMGTRPVARAGLTRVLVASTGGHLAEMLALAPRLVPAAADELWVTFESEQSRSLLAGRRVKFIRDTPPRDWRAIVGNLGAARRVLSDNDVASVVSTGAGVALSFLPLARLRRIPAHYIESCARSEGPSLTGLALQRIGGVNLYTQHEQLATTRWQYRGSVFDTYERVKAVAQGPLRKVVVTVGTLPFSFARLIARLHRVLPSDVQVLIQSGATVPEFDWPTATIRSMMPPEDLRYAMEQADAVIAHAGVGSLLMAFDSGKVPILVPRVQRYREHVDDHQVSIARAIAAEGLAVVTDASEIALADIVTAAGWALKRSPAPAAFDLS